MPKDVILAYGKFFNALINFIIQAFAIFPCVKVINNMRRKEEAALPPPVPTTQEVC